MPTIDELKTSPEKVDGRSTLKSPESITFRCDLASKNMIRARAVAYGYNSVSSYLRDAGVGALPQIES